MLTGPLNYKSTNLFYGNDITINVNGNLVGPMWRCDYFFGEEGLGCVMYFPSGASNKSKQVILLPSGSTC